MAVISTVVVQIDPLRPCTPVHLPAMEAVCTALQRVIAVCCITPLQIVKRNEQVRIDVSVWRIHDRNRRRFGRSSVY